jgi:ABC-type antimicrobial peptide transport system permease subunit
LGGDHTIAAIQQQLGLEYFQAKLVEEIILFAAVIAADYGPVNSSRGTWHAAASLLLGTAVTTIIAIAGALQAEWILSLVTGHAIGIDFGNFTNKAAGERCIDPIVLIARG